MTYSFTGNSVSSTYGRLVQVVLGSPNTYYDGFGNLLNLGSSGIGPTGSNGSSIVWNGEWDSMMNYFPLDLVSYQNSTYICTNTPTGGAPYSPPDVDTASWDLVIQNVPGATGSQGATGPTGPQPNYYLQDTVPASASVGERWFNLSTAIESVYIYDGDNYLWVAPAVAGPKGETGSSNNNYSQVSSVTYSLTTSDNVVGVDTSTNITTLILPDSVSSERVRYEIKDIGLNAQNNNITIQTSGSDTIISTTISSSFIMSSAGAFSVLFNTANGTWLVL